MFWLSMTFTLLHTAEETFGCGAPLWRYLNRVTGVKIPDWLGVLLFVVGLLGTLGVVAWWGYNGSSLFLGLLLGSKLGDCVFMHWIPSQHYQPNPGSITTVLYIIEVVMVLVLGLEFRPLGFVLGILFFAAIRPTLNIVALIQSQGD